MPNHEDAAKVRLIQKLELDPEQELRVYKLIEGPIKAERLWAGVFPTYPSNSEIWGQVGLRLGGGRYAVYAKRPRPRFIKTYCFNAPDNVREPEKAGEERSLLQRIIDERVGDVLENDPELMHEVVVAYVKQELSADGDESEDLMPDEKLRNELILNDPEIQEALRLPAGLQQPFESRIAYVELLGCLTS